MEALIIIIGLTLENSLFAQEFARMFRSSEKVVNIIYNGLLFLTSEDP